MKMEGLSEAEARSRIALFDTKGLVVEGRAGLAPHKQPWAQKLPASKPFDRPGFGERAARGRRCGRDVQAYGDHRRQHPRRSDEPRSGRGA